MAGIDHTEIAKSIISTMQGQIDLMSSYGLAVLSGLAVLLWSAASKGKPMLWRHGCFIKSCIVANTLLVASSLVCGYAARSKLLDTVPAIITFKFSGETLSKEKNFPDISVANWAGLQILSLGLGLLFTAIFILYLALRTPNDNVEKSPLNANPTCGELDD